MRIAVALVAMMVLGCAESVPECFVGEGELRDYPGEPRCTGNRDAVGIQYVAACEDDAMVRCHTVGDEDEGRDFDVLCPVLEGHPQHYNGQPYCAFDGSPRCVPVPCDGEFHRAGDL